jgi:HlyD family secretion protein
MHLTIEADRCLLSRSGKLAVFLAIALFAVPLATACSTSKTAQTPDVVVNAPADGVVRRILVSEGTPVDKDAAIIEISVRPQQTSAAVSPAVKAQRSKALRAAETDLVAAEGEANRTAADLKRIEPLVKRGLASQAELDKARGANQDAQERVRLAQDKARIAKESLDQPAPADNAEQIVAVRVPSAGTVRSLNVTAGQSVKAGDPVAKVGSQS